MDIKTKSLIAGVTLIGTVSSVSASPSSSQPTNLKMFENKPIKQTSQVGFDIDSQELNKVNEIANGNNNGGGDDKCRLVCRHANQQNSRPPGSSTWWQRLFS